MYFNLRTAMRRERVTVDRVAKALGLHKDTVSKKIAGELAFTFEEAVTIRRVIFPQFDLLWLFARNTSALDFMRGR